MTTIPASVCELQMFTYVAQRRGFTVLVSEASTPAVLSSVLDACTTITHGGFSIIFAPDGEEQSSAVRAEIGHMLALAADEVIVCQNDSDEQDPEGHMGEVFDAVEASPTKCVARLCGPSWIALQWILHNASADDLILIAGKVTDAELVLKYSLADRTVRRTVKEAYDDDSCHK